MTDPISAELVLDSEQNREKKDPHRTKRLINVMVGNVLAKAMLWGTVAMGLFVLVPEVVQVFADWDITLPKTTQWTLGLGLLAYRYWYFVAPVIVAIYAADMFVTFRLYSKPSRPTHRLLWNMIAIFIPVVLVTIMIVAILLPLPRVDFTLSAVLLF